MGDLDGNPGSETAHLGWGEAWWEDHKVSESKEKRKRKLRTFSLNMALGVPLDPSEPQFPYI